MRSSTSRVPQGVFGMVLRSLVFLLGYRCGEAFTICGVNGAGLPWPRCQGCWDGFYGIWTDPFVAGHIFTYISRISLLHCTGLEPLKILKVTAHWVVETDRCRGIHAFVETSRAAYFRRGRRPASV